MKVGLLAVDNSSNFPSLPLMKISSYHKMIGDQVEIMQPYVHYDQIYVSKVFSNSPDYKYRLNADNIIKGGTGYPGGDNLPDNIEHIYPDYSLYPSLTNDAAFGFLTRGCPRNCEFCIVTDKEGNKSVRVAGLREFWSGQKNIILLDPNFLACKDKNLLFHDLIESKSYINFTQGLDIRLLNDQDLHNLKLLKIRRLHFAWDMDKDSDLIIKNLTLLKSYLSIDKRSATVYVLTNYGTSFDFDMYRVKKIMELGFTPYVMIYDKHLITQHNKLYRTRSIMMEFASWVNQPNYFYRSKFNEFLIFRGIKQHTPFYEDQEAKWYEYNQ